MKKAILIVLAFFFFFTVTTEIVEWWSYPTVIIQVEEPHPPRGPKPKATPTPTPDWPADMPGTSGKL